MWDTYFINTDVSLLFEKKKKNLQELLCTRHWQGEARLLIYDTVSCHISLEVVQLALKEYISILTLPGKTTGFLQPVDQILSNLESAFADLAFNISFTKADFFQ